MNEGGVRTCHEGLEPTYGQKRYYLEVYKESQCFLSSISNIYRHLLLVNLRKSLRLSKYFYSKAFTTTST